MREDFDTQVMNVLRQMGLSGAANFIGQAGATMPGTVLGGEGGFKTREEPLPFDRTPEQRRKASFDVGMGLGPGILTAVGRVRPPHVVANDLLNARTMEKAGYHPQEIWDALGVARGADRFWREEMPGAAADPETLDALRRVLNRSEFGQAEVDLGAVASKEFAAAYPELMNKEFVLNKQRPLGLGSGGMNPETGDIFLSPGGALNLPSMFEHEAQHGVQRLHGWNEGGSPMGMSYKDLARLPNETLLRIARFAEKGGENIPQHVAFSAMEDPMFLHYLRLAGEAEARNAARRMVDPSLRRQVPSRTEDIPRRFQDVKLPRDFVPPEDPYAGRWQTGGKELDPLGVFSSKGGSMVIARHIVDLQQSGDREAINRIMPAWVNYKFGKASPEESKLIESILGGTGHWRSPLYESQKNLLTRSGNPNIEGDAESLRGSAPVTQQWKPDPDQLKQIRRIQKWLQLVEEATKKGK